MSGLSGRHRHLPHAPQSQKEKKKPPPPVPRFIYFNFKKFGLLRPFNYWTGVAVRYGDRDLQEGPRRRQSLY